MVSSILLISFSFLLNVKTTSRTYASNNLLHFLSFKVPSEINLVYFTFLDKFLNVFEGMSLVNTQLTTQIIMEQSRIIFDHPPPEVPYLRHVRITLSPSAQFLECPENFQHSETFSNMEELPVQYRALLQLISSCFNEIQ